LPQVRDQLVEVGAADGGVGSLGAVGELLERQASLPRRLAEPVDGALALAVRGADGRDEVVVGGHGPSLPPRHLPLGPQT
jgi:hypothetical protein